MKDGGDGSSFAPPMQRDIHAELRSVHRRNGPQPGFKPLGHAHVDLPVAARPQPPKI
jgi:hypothetical protein